MTPEETDIVPLVCEVVVWLLLGTGVICGLLLAFRNTLRKGYAPLPAIGVLRGRPFTFVHALPVIALTGLFALMGAFHAADDGKHVSPTALITGMGISAGLGFFVITLCTALAGKGFRAVFGSPACTWPAAVGKGFVYGLVAIPVVAVAMQAVSEIGEALELDMSSQEMFTWLGDPSFSILARATLIVFAVVVAPVTEELLFRGILLPALMKSRRFVFAVLLNSFYFSLIHLHGPSLLPLIILSVMFSAGYAVTGSILTPIVMHVLFNAAGLLFFFASAGT